MNNQIPVESLLYSNYIKYDKLSELVENNFQGSNANSVNIFIDIYSLIKGLYKCDTFTRDNGLVMSSSMINLCAHLRHFFRNRYNVESKIYLIYSDNVPEYNKKLWLGYNQNHEKVLNREAGVNELIKQNLSAIDTLSPYLPDIYFLITDFEAGVLMYDIICYNESKENFNPNIIITKDVYLYQLVGLCQHSIIFRPKKSNSEDISFAVKRSNVLAEWFISKNVAVPEEVEHLDAGLCSLLMTLSRCPERSIKSFFNLPKASEIICSGVSGYKILNGYNAYTKKIWDLLYRPDFDKYTFDLFDRRFKVIDILSQYYVYTNVKHNKLKFINLVDPNTIKDINNKYFEKYPLDLDRL